MNIIKNDSSLKNSKDTLTTSVAHVSRPLSSSINASLCKRVNG